MKFYPCFVALLSLFSSHVNADLPVVTKVSPMIGPAAGGTSVTIMGSGFTEVVAVDFGIVPAAAFTIESDTSITAVTSAYVPQVVSLTVTTADGTSLNSENSFYVYQGCWRAYVSNLNDNTVSIVPLIDTATSITVAAGTSPDAMAIAPDGTRVYIGNQNSSDVSILHTATDSITSTVAVGSDPAAIAVMPDGRKAYVANYNDGTVSVIDTMTGEVMSVVAVGSDPDAIAILSDGRKAYVANYGDGTVSVIDTVTDTVDRSIEVGIGPVAIVIAPDKMRVYVLNYNDDTVSIIDTSIHTLCGTVSVGKQPSGVAISQDGRTVYVANSGEATLSIIDATSQTVSNEICVGNSPLCVTITPDGMEAYVVNYKDGTVSVIDTATGLVKDTVFIDIFPSAAVIAPAGGQVYVLHSEESSISIISTANKSVSSVLIGDGASLMVLTPDQAPLAHFSATTQNAGLESLFDASTSMSPTGTIVKYSWSFGDDTALDTSSPSLMHTYKYGNMYAVTLVVTNSAGTSVSQVFNANSFSNNNYASYASPLTNNGGMIASMTKMLEISPLPPTKGIGKRISHRAPFQLDVYNLLAWTPSHTKDIKGYDIYRNGLLILKEYPNTQYKDYKGSKVGTDVYDVRSVISQESESIALTITVN